MKQNKTRSHEERETKNEQQKGRETKQETTCNPCISRGVYAIRHTGFGTQAETRLVSLGEMERPFHTSHLVYVGIERGVREPFPFAQHTHK